MIDRLETESYSCLLFLMVSSLLSLVPRATLSCSLLLSPLSIVDRCHRIFAAVQRSNDRHQCRSVRFGCRWNRIFPDLDQITDLVRQGIARSRTRILIDRLFQIDIAVVLVNDVLILKRTGFNREIIALRYLQLPIVLVEKLNGVFDVQSSDVLNKIEQMRNESVYEGTHLKIVQNMFTWPWLFEHVSCHGFCRWSTAVCDSVSHVDIKVNMRKSCETAWRKKKNTTSYFPILFVCERHLLCHCTELFHPYESHRIR